MILVCFVAIIVLGFGVKKADKRIDTLMKMEQTQTEFNKQIIDILKAGE